MLFGLFVRCWLMMVFVVVGSELFVAYALCVVVCAVGRCVVCG
jgi:hypothetical protein